MSKNASVAATQWYMAPVEVDTDIAFLSPAKRRGHVLKHVFGYPDDGERYGAADDVDMHAMPAPNSKKEKWRRVFDSNFAAALVASREGRVDSPKFQQLEEKYEHLLSRLFIDKCREAIDHAHFAKVKTFDFEDEMAKPTDGVVKVILACPSKRVFAIAAAFVTDARLGRYSLLSGYRPWPELGGAGFRRDAREKLFREKDGARLVADHTHW